MMTVELAASVGEVGQSPTRFAAGASGGTMGRYLTFTFGTIMETPTLRCLSEDHSSGSSRNI